MDSAAPPAATAAWPSTEALLENILFAGGHARLLLIAHNVPPAFDRSPIALTHIGHPTRVPTLACCETHAFACHGSGELGEALRRVAACGLPPHDLVYVDFDHRATTLVTILRALPGLSRPDTLWLFDDAVPRSPEIATARPTEG